MAEHETYHFCCENGHWSWLQWENFMDENCPICKAPLLVCSECGNVEPANNLTDTLGCGGDLITKQQYWES